MSGAPKMYQYVGKMKQKTKDLLHLYIYKVVISVVIGELGRPTEMFLVWFWDSKFSAGRLK